MQLQEQQEGPWVSGVQLVEVQLVQEFPNLEGRARSQALALEFQLVLAVEVVRLLVSLMLVCLAVVEFLQKLEEAEAEPLVEQ